MNASLTPGNDTLLIKYAIAELEVVADNLHLNSFVYPTLDDGVLLTSAAGEWSAYPDPVEIMPASTIDSIFAVYYIDVPVVSDAGEYEIKLFKGAEGSEEQIAQASFSAGPGLLRVTAVPTDTDALVANERISGAISSGNAAVNTVRVKLYGKFVVPMPEEG